LTFDIDVDGSNLAAFTYDARGLLASRTLENGTTSTYTYDAAARLQAMRGIVPVTYSLNATGQRTGRHDAAFGPETFTYDAIDQVIGANYGGVRSEGFAYDAMGNRQSASDTAAGITAYTVRADNAYTSVGGISTQTDLNGNMVASPLKTENGTLKTGIYAYDAQNRLVRAERNGTVTEFEYDGFNRCLQRRTTRAGGGEESLRLVYAGWDLIEERDGEGALTAQYVHGVQTDDIVAKSATSGTVYYHRDGLGSTVALSDATGQIVERYRYDVFGRVEIRSATGESVPASLFGNRFLFTGREWLSEVGLYDYRNRVYSAELGRFLQTDPIRFSAGDGNLYRYVSNNPVNLWDPWGLFDVGFYGAGGNTAGNAALRDYVEGGGGKVYDRTQKGQQQALEDIKKAREAGDECLNISGYSWGTRAARDLVNKLKEQGINVDQLNLVDPVNQFGQPGSITVPDNVKSADNYYQTSGGPFQGGPAANPGPNVRNHDMSGPDVDHNDIVSRSLK